MRIALEGAIVCCESVLDSALRGACCAIGNQSKLTEEHAIVYV